jgi:hypothetical protein
MQVAKLPWVKIVMGVMGSLAWCVAIFVVRLMEGKNSWYLSLIVCKNM